MTWAERVKQEKPRPKLYQPPEEEREYLGQAEAYRRFWDMLKTQMPRIAEETRQR